MRFLAQMVLDLSSWVHIQQVRPLIALVGWDGEPLLIIELAWLVPAPLIIMDRVLNSDVHSTVELLIYSSNLLLFISTTTQQSTQFNHGGQSKCTIYGPTNPPVLSPLYGHY